MGRRAKEPADADKTWVCERCGTVFEGRNPPDKCSYCGCRYFENLLDTLRELESGSSYERALLRSDNERGCS